MLDGLVTSVEGIAAIMTALTVIGGAMSAYVIRPLLKSRKAVHEALMQDIHEYRESQASALKELTAEIKSVRDDQHSNHVCMKKHTGVLEGMQRELNKGSKVMQEQSRKIDEFGCKVARLEGRFDEHKDK